jgi:hypothetical protein
MTAAHTCLNSLFEQSSFDLSFANASSKDFYFASVSEGIAFLRKSQLAARKQL